MTAVPDAEDPQRYHPGSAIHQYLTAKAASALTPDLATALKPAAVHDRWAVKTAADSDAQALVSQVPTPTTIAELTALAVPPMLPPDRRSDGAEKTVWQLTATLQAFGQEADGDYHMVLADSQGNTMIGEIPNPDGITAPSYFATQIANARAAFDSHFRMTENVSPPAPPAPAAPEAAAGGALTEGGTFRQVAASITLTGLGFFDFAHGQQGVAPNAIELHPVISVVFNG
jgi:hypothetical protein